MVSSSILWVILVIVAPPQSSKYRDRITPASSRQIRVGEINMFAIGNLLGMSRAPYDIDLSDPEWKLIENFSSLRQLVVIHVIIQIVQSSVPFAIRCAPAATGGICHMNFRCGKPYITTFDGRAGTAPGNVFTRSCVADFCRKHNANRNRAQQF